MIRVIVIIINIFLGLRIITGVSNFDFAGFGTALYYTIIVLSILFFLYQIFQARKKESKKAAVSSVLSILFILGGIAVSPFVVIYFLNHVGTEAQAQKIINAFLVTGWSLLNLGLWIAFLRWLFRFLSKDKSKM
ncbi:hypothetical protein [Jeotgalibaca caeni]|uniref:hypothetical protein n=1 Tax=Jeotgalibaca caeni TaxID=3028623 RepID=UPI00237E5D83|nr:hypothetical protein [Jeotgalibaca caeni]MDE1549213.1 hypothetical protein [Jeotgalibaca caeni]